MTPHGVWEEANNVALSEGKLAVQAEAITLRINTNKYTEKTALKLRSIFQSSLEFSFFIADTHRVDRIYFVKYNSFNRHVISFSCRLPESWGSWEREI